MNLLNINTSNYSQQLEQKKQYLQQLLTPFSAPKLQVFASPEQNYRMRAEFRIWRDNQHLHYAMFQQGNKHHPILLEELPIASVQINELMPSLKKAWQQHPPLATKLFQVEFLTTTTHNALITLCYHCPLDEQWQQIATTVAKELNINIIGRSRKQKIIIGKDYVTETLTVANLSFTYQQPEGAFTQPNAAVNTHMLNWAWHTIEKQPDDLLELYCGNGNFTLPLSTQVRRVLATEISKSSVHAALENIKNNHISTITLARLSAEELTQALNNVRPFRRLETIDLTSYQFGTVFVDPPRAGMDKDTCELTRRFDRILYISCNPTTLVENIAQLSNTHRITQCALFDQFPYTPHIETGVLLERI